MPADARRSSILNYTNPCQESAGDGPLPALARHRSLDASNAGLSRCRSTGARRQCGRLHQGGGELWVGTNFPYGLYTVEAGYRLQAFFWAINVKRCHHQTILPSSFAMRKSFLAEAGAFSTSFKTCARFSGEVAAASKYQFRSGCLN